MMTESTAVVAPEAPTDDAIAQIRRAGSMAVAERKEVSLISRQISGLEWGKSFSEEGRYAIAAFARVCRANIIIHVDILGGKPYLNAQYWADYINQHPRFHHYEQTDLSPAVEQALRDAGQEDAADEMAIRRIKWSPRENATVVIETTIYRFINAAPMDKIQSGEITNLDQYLISVSECNWAGGMGDTVKGKKDPVGDSNPGTTARSRSLRRCAVKSFSAWMEQYDAQIRKAEDVIEAEYEIISSEALATEALRPQPDGPQAVLSSGEPTAVTTEEAEPLPEEEAFDPTDARKRFFATFRDAGMDAKKDRKKWAAANNLPESSKDWGREDYDRAQEILMEPAMKIVRDFLDGDKAALKDLSLEVLKKEVPEFLRDWNALGATLEARAADADASDEDEAGDIE